MIWTLMILLMKTMMRINVQRRQGRQKSQKLCDNFEKCGGSSWKAVEGGSCKGRGGEVVLIQKDFARIFLLGVLLCVSKGFQRSVQGI